MNEPIRSIGDDLYRMAGVEVEHHEERVAGLTTHWVTAGPVEAPHSVLLHGSGGSAALWYPVLAALAERRRVVAVDLPGLAHLGRARLLPAALCATGGG